MPRIGGRYASRVTIVRIMNLYLIRHGKAEPRREGLADEDRGLTKEGKRELVTLVGGLAALQVSLNLVLTSPWRRAVETAQRMSFLGDPEIRETTLLAMAPSTELLTEIGRGTVALVGHQPWMSMLLSWLVTGSQDKAANFPVKKGQVAHLRGEPLPGQTELLALLPPRVFRRLGG